MGGIGSGRKSKKKLKMEKTQFNESKQNNESEKTIIQSYNQNELLEKIERDNLTQEGTGDTDKIKDFILGDDNTSTDGNKIDEFAENDNAENENLLNYKMMVDTIFNTAGLLLNDEDWQLKNDESDELTQATKEFFNHNNLKNYFTPNIRFYFALFGVLLPRVSKYITKYLDKKRKEKKETENNNENKKQSTKFILMTDAERQQAENSDV